MKSLAVVLLLYFLFIDSAVCQSFYAPASGKGTKEVILMYDSKTNEFVFESGSERSLKAKDKYVIRLKNYNSYTLKPSVTIKSVNYKTGVPGRLSEYIGASDVTLGTDFVAPRTSYPNMVLPALSTEIKYVSSRIDDEYSTLLRNVENANKFAFAKAMTQDQVRMYLDVYKEKASVNITVLKDSLNNLMAMQNRYENLVDILKEFNDTYSRVITFQKAYLKIATKALNVDDPKISIDSFRTELLKQYNIAALSVTANRDLKSALEQEITDLQGLYTSASVQVAPGSIINRELQTSITQSNKQIGFVNANVQYFKDNIQSFVSLCETKQGYLSKEQSHAKIADASRVRIILFNQVNPKDTILNQVIEIPTRGGIDVDFSTGFVYNSIYRQPYSLQIVKHPLDSTKAPIKSVKKESAIDYDIAVAAFINFSWRLKTNHRVGISPGIGLSIMDANLRYLVGGHYHFGKRSLLGITAGLAWGKVAKLSKAISDDGVNPNTSTVNGSYSSVPTYDVMDRGWYAGLVWNLARK